jgi:hypothetical protein
MSFTPPEQHPASPLYAPPPVYAYAGPPVPSAGRPRSRALGLAAMIVALWVTLLSIVASVLTGLAIAPLVRYDPSTYGSPDGIGRTPAQEQTFGLVTILMGAHVLLGTLLGIVALVLGIVAAATGRGRAFGIVAIVLAVIAPIASYLVYTALTI